MSLSGRLTVSDEVSCPLLPELNVPVAIRGLAMVVSFYVDFGTASRASAISASAAKDIVAIAAIATYRVSTSTTWSS